MGSLNKVQLIGNLGQPPELRFLPDGTPTATVSLATTHKWKSKASGELKEATEWHRVVFYGRLAEVVGEYLVTGSTVYVEGHLKTRRYTDGDGVERWTTEIRANELIMLAGRRKEATGAEPAEGATRFAQDPMDDDDIPF